MISQRSHWQEHVSVQEQELNIQISLFDEHEVTCSCRLGHEPIYIIIVCNHTSGSRIWSGGGPRKFRAKFCRRSGAELCERSEPQSAGVQGPP